MPSADGSLSCSSLPHLGTCRWSLDISRPVSLTCRGIFDDHVADVRGAGSARWPDSPLRGKVPHWVGLIPVGVAGESVQVGGGVEQKEEKLGMFRSDMACGWNVLENAHRIVSTCS